MTEHSIIAPSAQNSIVEPELSSLPVEIKREYSIVVAQLQSSLTHAIRLGQLLCEAKEAVKHGQWLTWFEASEFEFSERAAQRYMRLYRNRSAVSSHVEEAGSNAGFPEVTQNAALAVLAKHRPVVDADTSHDESTSGPKPDPAGPSNDSVSLGKNAGHASPCTGSWDEWKTPARVLAAVTSVLGEIDLDPASDGRHVDAQTHFTAEQDGLEPSRSWQGRVFLNPPLRDKLVLGFINRLLDEIRTKHVSEAIVLVPAMTDANWFRKLGSGVRCFLAKPDVGEVTGVPRPLVAIYLGQRQNRFCSVFSSFGDMYARVVASRNR